MKIDALCDKGHRHCSIAASRTLRKTFVIMKLTLIILTATLLQVSAEGYAQKITLSEKNARLETLFEKIHEQSGYFFLYNNQMLSNSPKVDIKVKNASLESTLAELFKNQPLTYTIRHKTVVVQQKKVLKKPVDIAVDTLRGQVTDTLGLPLPGVSVIVKNTQQGVSTDMNGSFTLNNVADDATLVVSFIGFKTQEIAVNGRSSINIALKMDLAKLDEVVVVGFGTQKKVNLTGAVASISGEVLESRPIANIGQGLQGLVPNLNINISNGSPNTSPSINVRGGTTFANNSFITGSPLILVDGIEMDINQLNPADIASISVLKDAASAAIYGARAAYGVVLVTTKSGKKSGSAQITYNNLFQWNKPSAIPNLLDAYTIQLAANQAYGLENKSVPSDLQTRLEKIEAYMTNPETAPIYYMSPGGEINWVGNTDVFDLALSNASPMQKHNLSVSGGSEKSRYYASLGYQNQDGLYKLNTDNYKRYNAMLNLTSDVNDWFSVNFRSLYNNSTYSEPVSPAGKGGWWTAMSQEPERNINMPIKTPENSPVGVMYTDNILSFMDYGSLNEESKETTVLALSPTITPLKGWNIKGDFSYKSYNFNQKEFVPELERIVNRWDSPTTVHTSPTYLQRWNIHSNQYTINAYSDYTFSLKKHTFYGLAGYNQEWYTNTTLGGRGEDILSPNIPVINQTLGKEYASDGEAHWAIRGAFYRLTYNFDNRYLLESNGRYDGTSRFPTDRRFKFFASFSGAWRISEESFMESAKPLINNLKIRGSYGSLGNQNVANYIYIPSYGTISEVNYLFNGSRPVGITPPGLVDPFLTWETATTVDFGLDATLFNKLDVTFDWYNRTTSDILVAGDKYPAVLGVDAPTKNSGEMKTVGWELSTKWRDRLQSGFSYDIGFVLSDYQSEITAFNGNPNKLLSSLYTGKKMGEIWGYETVGTFQTQADIDAAPSQELISSGTWYPGDIQYKDSNGDGKIGPGANTVADPGDRKIIGNSTPRYRFGLNMNAAWKGFDLNVFFQGVGKRDYWIGSSLFWGDIAGGTGTWDVYNNSWTPERTNAFYPAYKTKGANIQSQTKYLQNAAYIRLKNVTLGYTLPKSVTGNLKIDQFRVFLSAYNIWSHSQLPEIFDPELLSANYPMYSSLALGLQVKF